MHFSLPRLYPITDRLLSGTSHVEQVELLAAGGATLIQLREKTASPREFYDMALVAVEAAHRLGTLLIINDRVDIALAVGADGVHLGQQDIPPDRARRLLGEECIIGFSTHTLEQATEADSMPVDYIAIGPVFQTHTKSNPDPVVGLDIIAEVKRRVSRPVVAIGGVTYAGSLLAIAAGADSVAVISDLYSTGDLKGRTRDFIEHLATAR